VPVASGAATPSAGPPGPAGEVTPAPEAPDTDPEGGEAASAVPDDPSAADRAPIVEGHIDPDALKVVRRLRRHGFAAYLVGGGVRDLLLGRRPKDFDIATAATPNEVRRLFRNCRVIGRRFRLAHIHFRDNKILEVSTFRATPTEDREGASEELLIKRDNTFGNAEQDARRRDFTINGLFYDTEDHQVIDYVGGLGDLAAGIIRTIGDPHVRFREDPIRILRAIKFAARLTFDIEPETWRAAVELRTELDKAAAPRIVEEVFRMLKGGAAASSLRWLKHGGMLEMLLPELVAHVAPHTEHTAAADRLQRYLESLDELYREGMQLSNAVLLGAVIAPLIEPTLMPGGDDPGPQAARASLAAADQLLASMAGRLRISRRDVERTRQILAVQRRLLGSRRLKGRPEALATRDFFSDAMWLLELGCRASGEGEDALEYWGEVVTGRLRRRHQLPDEDVGAEVGETAGAEPGPDQPEGESTDEELAELEALALGEAGDADELAELVPGGAGPGGGGAPGEEGEGEKRKRRRRRRPRRSPGQPASGAAASEGEAAPPAEASSAGNDGDSPDDLD
jgi:poly(A) polymerase